MIIAFAIIQVHACLPHDHVALSQVETTAHASEEHVPFWNNLWHIDMGEDHLEIFDIGSSPSVFYIASEILPSSTPARRTCNAASMYPWTFALPPPRLPSITQLRAPPFFA
jgi:hypothetical protein